MAELFSLMPESTSCKTDPVEASRTLLRTILTDPFQRNAPAAGEISRDTCRASLGALPSSGRRLGVSREVEQHPHPALRATLRQAQGRLFSRREKDQKMPNAFSLREKVPEGRMRVLLCERRLSFMSWHYLKDGSPRRTAQKSMTEKAAKTNPSSRIRQHFQGVYFLIP
jgi:hypothetical protein